MINPLDVPMVFSARRENTIKSVYNPRCSFVSTPTSPTIREDKGFTLWGKLMRSMCRLPLTNGVDENSKPSLGYILFPPPIQTSISYPVELKAVNLHVVENTREHHTDEYNVTKLLKNAQLVVRRGQSFKIDLTFYRDFIIDNDELTLIFELGMQQSVSTLTKISLPVSTDSTQNKNERGWWAELVSHEGPQMTVKLNASINAVVGMWNLKVVTTLKRKEGISGSRLMDSQSLIRNFFIIFNPWCSDDLVYMPNQRDREEYILNDCGIIWRGSANALRANKWTYGQFEDDILEACLVVLDGSRLPMAQRSNPLQVARVIALMVNSVDDNGVIVGNWTSAFTGGTAPTDWTGSAKILHLFAQNIQPVLFGQCWVFAGLVTTIMRCLGIPTRVVTNYSSAHDTDTTISINTYFKSNGKIDMDRTRDTRWNFHTWNECWMARPDLPHGYGGWQAVDATPQEKTDGHYRIGPASVRAIREGEVGFCYETSCVFAEVNADRCYWMVGDEGNEKLISVNRTEIGKLIVTKKHGRTFDSEDLFEDITKNYKFVSNSDEERNAVLDTLLPGHSREIIKLYNEQLSKTSNDVEFSLQMKKQVTVGSDFEVELKIINNSNEQRNVKVWMRIESNSYHGGESYKIRSNSLTHSCKPNETRLATMPVSVNDYLGKTSQQTTFLVSILSGVKETGQKFAIVDDFCMAMPEINVKIPSETNIKEAVKIQMEFQNPLPVLLTRCKFIVDGPGVVEYTEVNCSDISPRGMASAQIRVIPKKVGTRLIVVHFTSDQLQDLEGSATINVKE